MRIFLSTFLIFVCLQINSQDLKQQSDSLFKIGVNYFNEHSFQKAIDAFENCRGFDCAYLDSTSHRFDYIDMWIGCSFYQMGNEKEAQRYNPYYYKYDPIDRSLTVKSDSLSDLYDMYKKNGNISNALLTLHKIIETETREIGTTNYWIANTYQICGRQYEEIDSMELAAYYYNKSYEIRNKILDSNHIDLAISMIDIGYCYKELSIDLVTATDCFKRGFEILSLNKEIDNYYSADRMHYFAGIFLEKKDYDSALSYELQSISIFKRVFGVHNNAINSCIARGYNSAMNACLLAKRYGDAEKYGERALSLRKELFGESDPWKSRTRLTPEGEVTLTPENVFILTP